MSGAVTPPSDLWALLGGRANVVESLSRGKRLLVTVRDPQAVDEAGLRRHASRGLVRTDDHTWQILTA
jgi:phosphotransferase system IIB component